MSGTTQLLKIEGLNAGYGPINVLWDIDLWVGPGEFVALVGSNGAGKTTLLRAVSGLLPASKGTISFSGRQINRFRADEIVRQRLVHVPEGRRLFADLTAEQNLLLGAITRNDKKAIAADLDRVYALFPVLRGRRNQAAGSMSGGEQQVCAIGRGIMAAPRLLLVDELSLGLAPALVDHIFHALIALRTDGMSLLIVDQDVEIALSAADRGYVLEAGRITASGAAADLLQNSRIRSAYLGL